MVMAPAHMLPVEVDRIVVLPLDAPETCVSESGFASLLITQRKKTKSVNTDPKDF